METTLRDLRSALRLITFNPAFALTVVLSLGLAIGANTTVFAWLDNIVRRPFPAIPDGRHLVAVNVADSSGGAEGMPPVAYPVLQEWLARVAVFDAVAAHAPARMSLRPSPPSQGDPIWAEIASANFFDTLRIQPYAGRFFNETDRRSGTPAIVVSHQLWQRRFGGATDLIGRAILLNGVSLTVVGIAPRRFGGVVTGLAFDAWVPLWMQTTLAPGSDWTRDRAARRMQAVGRLRSGVTLQRARHELNAVAGEVSRSIGETPVTGAAVRWVSDTQLGSLMRPLGSAMLAIAAIVLMTACANIAGLLLACGVSRRRQTAIHAAMGATHRDLARQAVVQAAVLASLGCAVGLWIARMTKDSLVAFVPRVALPVNLEIDLNWTVVAFAALLAGFATVLVALLPVWRTSRLNLADALKSGESRGRSRGVVRHALVVAQVAFSLTALTTGALFLRSISAAGQAPLGFGDPRRVLLASTDLSFTRLAAGAQANVLDQALERVRGLPGVTNAAFASFAPLGFGGPPAIATQIDGYVPAPQESMFVDRAIVTDGYFDTMQIPIVDGRPIGSADRALTMRVVVVNEAFADRYSPGQTALDHRLEQGDGWATIVGVARNSAIGSLTESPRPLVYHAWAQRPVNGLTLHLRAAIPDPLALVEPVRRSLAAAHSDLPVLDPGTLADQMQAATFVQTVGAGAFSLFGLIAILICTIGIHGVVALYVAERRRDIAITVALGASRRSVAAAVARPVVGVTLGGIAIGAALSIATAAVVRNLLIGVSVIDAASLSGSAALIAATGLLSCAWPIWRATTIDPLSVIKG